MIGTLNDPNELRTILGRAVTMAQGFISPHVTDDMRMLRRLKPTFLGRSAYVWLMEEPDEEHFNTAKCWASRVHEEVHHDIVCQACIFEAIYPEADEVVIPHWVFTDLGQEPEDRTFFLAGYDWGYRASWTRCWEHLVWRWRSGYYDA